MSAPTFIAGWDSSWVLPGFAGETVFHAGAVSAGSLVRKVLVTGTKGSAGSATPNQDVVRIYSKTDADTLLGAGTEGARQCYEVLDEAAGAPVNLWAAPAAEAGGAAAGTATLTVTGTATGPGTLKLWIDGDAYTVSHTSSDTPTTFAAAISAAINATARGSCSGGSSLGVATATRKSKGARGNDGSIFADTTGLTGGLAIALAGGASIPGTSAVTGVRFTGGSGTEDVTTLLAVLYAGWYDYQAWAQNDSANMARVKAQLAAKAGPTENRIERAIFGQTGTLTAAQSLAQTTLNDPREMVVWALGGEDHPSEVAAFMAAIRAISERISASQPGPLRAGTPVAYYDDYGSKGLTPQRVAASIPSKAVLNAALLTGVTPLYTTDDKVLRVAMAVTSYSLNGSAPDYRCLQTYYQEMADSGRIDIGVRWADVKAKNPGIDDDTVAEAQEAQAGVMTPGRTNTWLTGILLGYQKSGWIRNVAQNPPTTAFDVDAKRLVSTLPMQPTPGNHQYGVSVRQL